MQHLMWSSALNEWRPPFDTWCWVRTQRGLVFPAEWSVTGEWSHGYTWEPFNHTVTHFSVIGKPPTCSL